MVFSISSVDKWKVVPIVLSNSAAYYQRTNEKLKCAS